MIPLRVDTVSGYLCRFAGRCVASMLVVTFCSAAVFAAAPPERIKVTATIFPLADIVRQVGGTRVHVVTLLPPGVRPFSYQPTLIQIRQTVGTSLYVRVGSDFDAWGDNLFSNAAEKPQTLTVTDFVDLLPPDRPSVLLDKGIPPGQVGKGNPWVWLDPVLVRDRILPAVTAALTRLRPGDARYFKVNERKYFEELTKLDEGMWTVLMRLPGKGFVSTHPLWGYLAKRYGLRQAAVIEPSASGAPVQRNQDTLVETARKLGIVAVFGDPWSTVSAAREFANRIHGRFVMLDPLGGAQLPGRYSYSALMKYNLALIRTVAEVDVHTHSPESRHGGGKAGNND